MLEKLVIVSVALGAVLSYLTLVDRFTFGRGPQTFFLLLACGTFASTVYVADASQPGHVVYASYISLGIAAFCLGCMLAAAITRFQARRELAASLERPAYADMTGYTIVVVHAIGLSALAFTLSYYWYLGYFVPAEAVRAAASGAAAVVWSELRTEIHQFQNTAPGYAMQFKDWLLSLYALLLFFWMKERPTWRRRIIAGGVFIVACLAMVGTGRRTGLVFFGVGFLTATTWNVLKPFTLSRAGRLLAVGGLLAGFGGMTALMGRGRDGGFFETLVLGPYFLFERAFVAPAGDRLALFDEFLWGQPASYGRGWLSSLEGVLPGKQTNVANEMHEFLYGNYYGNAGLDIWGSTWSNFHWFGIGALALTGFVMQLYYVWMIRGPKRVSRLVILVYAAVILGVSEEPYTLLINGFATMLIVLAVLYVTRDVRFRRLRTYEPAAEG